MTETQKNQKKKKIITEPIVLDTYASNDPALRALELPRNSQTLPIDISHRRTHKFTHEQKLQIIKLLACHTPYPEIKKIIRERWDMSISTEQLYAYKEAEVWKPYFERFQEEFERDLLKEPLASKRIRIMELSKAYKRFEKKNKTLRHAVDVLSKIRDEMEGKSSNVTVNTQYNQYNSYSDDELRRIIVENTKFLEISEKKKQELENANEDAGLNGA